MTRNPQASTLVIQVQTGKNAAGKPTLKGKSYPILDAMATDDAVFAVGQALASLHADPVAAIERVDRAVLVASAAGGSTSAS